MSPAFGVTPAGFVVKPLSQIQTDMQSQILGTVDPQLDLSPQTPDGQFLGIYANASAGVWELAQIVWNAFNRDDVEGTGLDNLGALIGIPREGSDFSQVVCTLALLPGVYAASTWSTTTGLIQTAVLLANVQGSVSQQFANPNALTVTSLSGTVSVTNGQAAITFSAPQTLAAGSLLIFGSQNGSVYTLSAGIIGATSALLTNPYTGTTAGATTATPGTITLFQATTIGDTPTVNDNTLTAITTAVSGWLSINNPPIGSSPNSSQIQLGQSEETDSAYNLRQTQDIAGEGGDTVAAVVAALNEVGASQVPPIALSVACLENKTNAPLTVNGFTLPPHSFAPVIWANGSTWPFLAGQPLIAQAIYKNKPPGITAYGITEVVIQDPNIGDQMVGYTVPAGLPLFITAIVVPRQGVVRSELVTAIQQALVAAATAPTLSTGVPPVGQLAPGTPVVYSQLAAVIMGVPGVFDLQIMAFAFAPNPTNVLPISLGALQVATIADGTVATNVILIQGTAP